MKVARIHTSRPDPKALALEREAALKLGREQNRGKKVEVHGYYDGAFILAVWEGKRARVFRFLPDAPPAQG